ncbi:hypothetical protein OG585_33145 [Streptomyces sp. NBC_01340]|uniref:hypothetical protein n=1 Tax=unclassified Streptomyces TaxID=2593676 RepID=UPI00225960C7|nr:MULTISPECIES: hypothetical protein [unclassified Streptomyces]MCX4457428.1 hypothetical protein [Streptomyces sp. NBC_01719]MCX4496785.1 hypothetical protein [Streptomyces sp. NBC_01728]WSI41668.1 hypothetical protein OG585_33145 [Streptomyces sp. NBC_01340]
MPSQPPTETNTHGNRDASHSPGRTIVDNSEGTVQDGGRRRVWRMELPVPKMPAIPTVTAVGSGGGLTAAIATGHVQPGVVWPAVVLAVAGMAYDVAIRALNGPRRV